MHDDFADFVHGLDAPAKDGFQVTPNDSADLPKVTRALYIGTGGTIRVTLASGAEVTFAGLNSGALLPIRAARVHATDTTATDLVGLL